MRAPEFCSEARVSVFAGNPHVERETNTMPTSTTLRLRKTPESFRLRKHADYQRVYKAGRKQFGRQMAYFFVLRDADAAARSETEGPRVGLTVPKALGKAVARNRIKRRLREAVRAALPLLSAPVDVVLHPKRSVLDAEFALIQREVETVFRAVQARAVQAAAEKRLAQSSTNSTETPR